MLVIIWEESNKYFYEPIKQHDYMSPVEGQGNIPKNIAVILIKELNKYKSTENNVRNSLGCHILATLYYLLNGTP